MSRVSGRTKRTIAFVIGLLATIVITFIVAEGNKGSSAAPQLAAPKINWAGDKIESGMWTDAQGVRWLKANNLFERKGQTFELKPHKYRLTTSIPVSMAYYDTAATDAMRRPTLITVFNYYGNALTLPFPPPQASRTCKYLVVLYVGLDEPRASETPPPGTLGSSSERVLELADHTTDPELQERCNPSPSRVRPS